VSPRIVPLEAIAPQPWRNGGGLTRELLRWPDPARHPDWSLRLSVADIEADGPFSAFDGVDRWFAVVAGAGVELGLEAGPLRVGRADAPVAFRGEAAPHCRLLDGPTRDLNLMLRRGAGRGGLRDAPAGATLAPHGGPRALFTAEPLALWRGDEAPLALPAMSLLWDDGADPQAWRIESGAAVRAWWIHFEPNR
jgi:hypothetical protein